MKVVNYYCLCAVDQSHLQMHKRLAQEAPMTNIIGPAICSATYSTTAAQINCTSPTNHESHLYAKVYFNESLPSFDNFTLLFDRTQCADI